MTNPLKSVSARAIVVGIEQYAEGHDWNLNGPARDAIGFTHWLRRQNVPADQITLFLSRLPENAGLEVPAGVEERPATEEAINNAFRKDWKMAEEVVLWIFWGGHGILSEDGSRRLFCADATAQDKRNVSLKELMLFLRSSYFPNKLPQRQIALVDACAHFAEHMKWTCDLPDTTYSKGAPVSNRRQFTLMAARPGEKALNLGAEKTGVFSRELLAQLENDPDGAWPPDMDALNQRLRQRFVQLRAEGKVKQTPAFYESSDWDDSVRSFRNGGQPATLTSMMPPPMRKLNIKEKTHLIEALLELPSMREPDTRQSVLNNLGPWGNSIGYNAKPRVHMINIVDTAWRHPGGMAELLESLAMSESAAVLQPLKSLVEMLLSNPAANLE